MLDRVYTFAVAVVICSLAFGTMAITIGLVVKEAMKEFYSRRGRASEYFFMSLYPGRTPGRQFATIVLIMALSIGGGFLGWGIARYVGDTLNSPTDISSQSRQQPR